MNNLDASFGVEPPTVESFIYATIGSTGRSPKYIINRYLSDYHPSDLVYRIVQFRPLQSHTPYTYRVLGPLPSPKRVANVDVQIVLVLVIPPAVRKVEAILEIGHYI
jgi:hypothetical protein